MVLYEVGNAERGSEILLCFVFLFFLNFISFSNFCLLYLFFFPHLSTFSLVYSFIFISFLSFFKTNMLFVAHSSLKKRIRREKDKITKLKECDMEFLNE